MELVVHDVESQAPVILHPPPMTDDEFYDFCRQYPDFRVERTARGEVVIMPPAGLETGFRNSELSAQLREWARKDRRGKAFDSNTQFILPSGAARCPDASWVDNRRLAALSPAEKQKFPRLCPDFVAELTSPSDRLGAVQEKMQEWMDAGARLGWLLNPRSRTAYIYRPGQPPEKLIGPARLHGEGPVKGFILELETIWAPL